MKNKENKKIKFIYADLQRTKSEDEIYLDTFGTEEDLKKYNLKFEPGEKFWFWRDDDENNPIIFSGIVDFDVQTNKWFVKIDKASLRHYSETSFAQTYSSQEIQGKRASKDDPC